MGLHCENCGLDIIGDYEIERVFYVYEYRIETRYYGKACWNELFGPEFGLTHTIME